MKTSKKLLSLLLVLTLLLSVSAPAFAAGGSTKTSAKKDYNVVYLGDSMSIGYFLRGYADTNGGNGCGIGWRQTGTNNYPTQFTDYLKNKLGSNYIVNPSYLGATGMRGNELCVLLEPNKVTEQYRDGFTKQHIGLYEKVYKDDDLGDVYECYQNAVKNADLIVYDLGINNFGTYLLNRMMDVIAGNEGTFKDDSLSLIMSQLSPELGQSVEDVRAFNRQLLEPLGAQVVDGLVDTLAYAHASFLYYFDKSMDYIYNNNKDVDVIVVGMFNAMSGAKIDVMGITIDLGEILQNTFSRMNFYITGMNEHRFQYKYADISGGVSRFLDEIARGVNASRNPMTDNTRDFLIDDFYKTLGDDNAAYVIGQNYDLLVGEEQALNAMEPAAISLTPVEQALEEAAPVEEVVEEAAPVEEVVEEAAPVEEIVESLEEQVNALEAIPTLVYRDAAKAAFYEGDYSGFEPLDKETVRAAVTMILENYRKAASNTTVDFNSISAFAAGEETYAPLVAQAMMDFDSADRAGQDLFFINLAFLAVRGFGVHPDQLGTNQKLAAVECAYNNIFTAAVNVPAKIVEAPIKAAAEIVKSVLVPPTKLLTSVVKGVVNATKSLLVIRW